MAKKKQFPSLFDVKEFISILDDRRFECPDGDRKTPLQNRREARLSPLPWQGALQQPHLPAGASRLHTGRGR